VSRSNAHRHARRNRNRKLVKFRGAGDVRGFGGLTLTPRTLGVGIGVIALILLVLKRKTVAQIATQAAQEVSKVVDTAKFAASLPLAIARYAPELLKASSIYGVDVWVLAGIMARESGGGVASGYKPSGDPGGTGDFIPRKTGPYAKYADPATGLPPDGKGWGRGLMQIDYGAHNGWVTSNPWWDPQTNINKAAQLLKANLDFFSSPGSGTVAIEPWRINSGMPQYRILPWKQKYPDKTFALSVPDPRPLSGPVLYEAAIAAYNAGTKGPLQAVASGIPAESVTSGQDYVSWFTSRIAAWQAKAR
jgi:hypothetical protein